MRKVILSVVLTLMLAMSASAQTKPYGAFDVGVECKNVPSWIVFSGIPSYTSIEDMAKARQCSERTGMTWVLKFGFDQIVNTLTVAQEVKTRAMVSGLLPYIVAVQFNEEWPGQAMQGQWGPPSFDLIDAIAQYGGEQQRILKQVFGLPTIYVDAFINNNRQYGLGFYHPLPPHTDLLGLTTYVPTGGSWNVNVQPFIDYTMATTHQPIVLIAQTFKHPKEWNDGLDTGPSKADGEAFKLLLQHPRVIAAWLFTWRSRANGIVGALDLPTVVGWFR